MSIRLNKVNEISDMLSKDPSILDCISKDGFTGLHLSSKYGFALIAKILLDYGASLEVVDRKYKRTCLHWASICGHCDVIQCFIRVLGDCCEIHSMENILINSQIVF